MQCAGNIRERNTKIMKKKQRDTFPGGWASSPVSSSPVDELSIYSFDELTGTVGLLLGFERFWDLLDFFLTTLVESSACFCYTKSLPIKSLS